MSDHKTIFIAEDRAFDCPHKAALSLASCEGFGDDSECLAAVRSISLPRRHERLLLETGEVFRTLHFGDHRIAAKIGEIAREAGYECASDAVSALQAWRWTIGQLALKLVQMTDS